MAHIRKVERRNQTVPAAAVGERGGREKRAIVKKS